MCRKRCTTRRGDRTLRKIVEKNRFQTLGNLRKQWTESGVETSRATVHRRVQEMGYRCRIPQARELRLRRSRSVKTRRGRHRMKMGGPEPDREANRTGPDRPRAIEGWREEGRIAVWMHVPITLSGLIAYAAAEGFTFHHAQNDTSTLTLWLRDGPSKLPEYATHQVGVAGAVLDEISGKVLVVQDKNKELDPGSSGAVHFCLTVWSIGTVTLLAPWALCDDAVAALPLQRPVT
ncbi:unnamed protein product [Ranitomeya imitator]|uniref:Nucleoside diphosphate-linked moiety X motif 6 n=1 Tax=Ranitomeya imitator TaxID=111125 RepID=A0ABN9MSN2_9NEOB|nr:unnamed protein product [Ranitomeya imitator]